MNSAAMELQKYRLSQGEPNRGDLGMFIREILDNQIVAVPITVILHTYRARRFPGWEKVTRFQLHEAINDLVFSRKVACDRTATIWRYRLRKSEEET